MTDLKQIPLRNFHAAHGARFVDFGGWEMPVQYTSILEEHRAVRTAAGLFDVSHMGELMIEGSNAAGFLDHLLTNRISTIPVGKAIYSPMCAEDGGVIDDLIVYRTAPESFLVCVNAGNLDRDLDWICRQAAGISHPPKIENKSDQFCLLALQGPKAVQILAKAGFHQATRIQRFHHALLDFDSSSIRICRTGYTGEDGFEIYLPPAKGEALAQCLLASGSEEGLKLCGLGARDSLRLEAGLPLYGHELSRQISPLEAGLAWTVKLQKDSFIGKAALTQQMEQGLDSKVIYFKMEGRRIARAGTSIFSGGGQQIGEVLSGTLSPMTGSPIGSARVASSALIGPIHVDLRGNREVLQIAKPPLHK